MKILLTILLVCFHLAQANNSDLIDITLKEYIALVSKQQNITILIDETVDQKISILINQTINKDTYLNVLRAALLKKSLKLSYKDNYYIIQKITDKDKTQIRSIILKYIQYENIKSIFEFYKINHKYIEAAKTILIDSNNEDYLIMRTVISKFDKPPNQLKLKITIIDTNLDDLKEYGIDNDFSLSPGSNDEFFFNLVAYPYTVTNDISPSSKNRFYSFVKFINDKGISKLVSTPILTLIDNKTTKFDVVTNIAYSTGEAVVGNDTSTTTKAYQYKDVGLQIKVTPTIYDSDSVYIDFDMSIDNVINGGDTPTTSKKHIKQPFYMQKNKVLILTGVNRNEKLETENGIPVLKDIPFLGWLFKYKSNSETSSTLSIALEIVDESEVKKDLDNNLSDTKKEVKEIVVKKTYNYPNEEEYLKAKELKQREAHRKRVKEIFGIDIK